jgi:hypothetical protein
MSSTAQVSLNNPRERQLAKIRELRKDIPVGTSEAVKFLLFEHMDKIAGGTNPPI